MQLRHSLFKLITTSLFLGYSLTATAGGYWQDMPTDALQRAVGNVDESQMRAKASQGRNMMITDIDALRSQLLANDAIDLELPLPNGQSTIYHLEYSPIAERGLLDKFPEIKTFRGVDIDNSNNHGRFDISPVGFRGMFRHNGEMVFIDPQYRNNAGVYLAYRSKDAQRLGPRPDEHHHHADLLDSAERAASRIAAKGSSDGNLRVYRLAVAATGEYTAFHGGTVNDAMNEIMTTINRINMVYQNDLGIRLDLVANNDLIVYTDASTDPFNNAPTGAQLVANQSAIDGVIGSGNYDIGHLFGTGGGGIAGLGVVCASTKAYGISGIPMPTGDAFDIDFVAHEMGHQFSANHSFNGTASSCFGSNRNPATAFEPGSGSTIMAYAGICDTENLQTNSDAYFHAGSIAEITSFVQSGNGAACGVTNAQVNNIPDANAGSDFTIPAATPFILSGSATDADVGDTLTYTWEQMDAGEASDSPATQVDNGDRALFRSFSPSTSSTRYLPRLGDIANGDSIAIGEVYPTTDRPLNFRLTARDNSGATAFDNLVVTVTTSAGPFIVTTPVASAIWNTGETQAVTWDVANTDVAPVSCSQVDILLSTDGGLSYPTVLLSATPNDGDESVTVPAGVSGNIRVMVRCSDNRFFAISGARPDVAFSPSSGSGGGSNSGSGGSSGGGGGGSAGLLWLFLLSSLFFLRGRFA